MRLFKTTIIVLEYNFPSTVDVVWKYVGWPGIKYKMKLTIASVAVRYHQILAKRNNESHLTSECPRLKNQTR